MLHRPHSGRPGSQPAGAPQLYAAVVRPVCSPVEREDSAGIPESIRQHEQGTYSGSEVNTYVSISRCCTPDEFKAAIIENCSRLASKGYSKPLRKEHLEGINKLLDTNFTQEDMEYIYTYLGNGIRHELCMKFVQSGYDLGVIDEGTQAKGGQA